MKPIIHNAVPPAKTVYPYKNKDKQADRDARKSAKENDQMTYNRILPCRRGHNSPRYVANDHCLECEKLAKIKHRTTQDKEKLKATKKKYHLKQIYNLTIEAYENLLNKQNYKCAICNNKLDLAKNTHVDHCHNTSKIRGILCHYCNLAIGNLKHNPELLRKAALYCEEI